MQSPRKGGAASSVLIEALRLSRDRRTVALHEVSARSRSSSSFARRVLSEVLGPMEDSEFSLSSTDRFRLALEASRAGGLREVARTLGWQEFERFAEECLKTVGFQTKRDVRVQGKGRSWQIDIVARREQLVLCFDCKHWRAPTYPSKFRQAAEHQRKATVSMVRKLGSRISSTPGRLWALPVIITLFDPPGPVSNGVVLLSVQRLPDFLNRVTPYATGLPFVSQDTPVQNPIREALR